MTVAVRTPEQIVKRDGRIVPFNTNNIHSALERCFISINDQRSNEFINDLVWHVKNIVSVRYVEEIPTVEQVQDIVIFVLQSEGEYAAAEHYIIYRYEHAKEREANYIPQDVVDQFRENAKYFPDLLQAFQYFDKYAIFDYDLERRETWPETVRRTKHFLGELTEQANMAFGHLDLLESTLDEIEDAILNMQVMPSMRLLAMAGPAARRENAALYNCSYLPIDGIDAYCELMYLLMQGIGVGYSVEDKNIKKLPIVRKQESEDLLFLYEVHRIEDSTEGWVTALRCGLSAWFAGTDIVFNYDDIRPQGSILKTKGGRASGPAPLKRCLDFIKNRMFSKQGKKLSTLDCHDIACAISRAVVSGGVRRSATIALFDEDDELMLHCKDGDFDKENDQRWCANNSAVWTNIDNITQQEFVTRMMTTFMSERGEPGIFSREIAVRTMPERRRNPEDKSASELKYMYDNYGCNPCGEIILTPWEFCNLSSVVARPEDTIETLKKKVELATIIGTIQSCATYFPGLRSMWAINGKSERLLGVDISGQMDSLLKNAFITEIDEEGDPILIGRRLILSQLQEVAIETNKVWADILGIKRSKAITCVKPSGNSSVLLNASSGIHPRWSEYYIRNVRVTANSPMYYVLNDAGVPMQPENGQDPLAPNVWVASFPVKSPDGAKVRSQVSAVEQCDLWLDNKKYWTEHNPSVSIYYRKSEVLDLLSWLWRNRKQISGMTFFPYSDAKYDQLPFVEITKEQYEELMANFPESVPFERLYLYDNKKDNTIATQLSACEGPVCEIEHKV